MPERPLLVFPEPQSASRSNPGGGGGSAKCPPHGRQGERLAPKFDNLQRFTEARRIEVQQSLVGVDPDQVLVIETIGSIDDFAKAVKKIPGLEWMGEIALEDIEPDDDFFDVKNPQKKLSGRLYLVLTNQSALSDLLSMWRRYKDNPEATFGRGLAKFRSAFDYLKDIRHWDVQDRLEETGVLEAWRENLEHGGDEPVRFEVELWFREDEGKRQQGVDYLRRLVTASAGRFVSECTIPEIAYHAVLGELPRSSIQEILANPSTALVKCESVMFFRPAGQVTAGRHPAEDAAQSIDCLAKPLPAGEPILAILDGLPIENHEALSGRLIIHDPDDWGRNYPAADRVHGTAMASLAIHGDYQAGESPLRTPVYVRPILRPHLQDFRSPRVEVVPDDLLTVDLIHRAVRAMFDGEAGEGPASPSVKIINLSVGDPCTPLDRAMSSWGRLLDWLSVHYNVLFVVSAGNHAHDIQIDLEELAFDSLPAVDREVLIFKALHAVGRGRRILSPAESLNAITVGALHADHSDIIPGDSRIDPVSTPLPSPVTSLGYGYRRTIKPDLLHPGGRQLYRKAITSSGSGGVRLQPTINNARPGCCVAHPGSGGDVSSFAFTSGTSNAAVLVSRNAAICFESLQELLQNEISGPDFHRYGTPLLKALLVHGCTWGEIGKRLGEVFSGMGDWRVEASILRRWLGYGFPDFSRSLECTEQRATVLGFGSLNNDEAHVFKLPLPPSLAARPEWRKVTVSLAWLSPTAPGTQKYRKASLWFETDAERWLDASRTRSDWQIVRKGSLQHEIFEGQRIVAISDGDNLTIKVNCREEAGPLTEAVPYGLVVSLEVAEGVPLAIYDEVRTRITVPIPIPN